MTVEDIAADIQRGVYQTPSFAGNISSHNSGFKSAVNAAMKYSGATILRDEVGNIPQGRFGLTQSQYRLLQKRH